MEEESNYSFHIKLDEQILDKLADKVNKLVKEISIIKLAKFSVIEFDR